jgi:hypothetical protein
MQKERVEWVGFEQHDYDDPKGTQAQYLIDGWEKDEDVELILIPVCSCF